jgi:hypothetical protein
MLGKSSILLVVLFVTFSFAYSAEARSYLGPEGSFQLAQTDTDESYDPFSDYSEFDEASDEEADINFFKNGRFFTIGLAVGMRGFTENLAKVYGSGASYGILLSYFFDLNLALQFGVMTGDYALAVGYTDSTGQEVSNTGSSSLTLMSFDLKYYLNTQNVTKGLADLNPYLIGGISQTYRTTSISGLDGLDRESVVGLDAGLGLEIPVMRHKSYIGVQGLYHLVQFKDENTPMTVVDSAGNAIQTNMKPRGDTYDLLFILGMNF